MQHQCFYLEHISDVIGRPIRAAPCAHSCKSVMVVMHVGCKNHVASLHLVGLKMLVLFETPAGYAIFKVSLSISWSTEL